MLSKLFTDFFERNIHKLKEEIRLYPDENSIWAIKDGISNSAGNLSLHICGNLQHFIGATLGNTGYIRNRDAEFSTKGVQKVDLISELDKTLLTVKSTLEKMSDVDFEKEYPLEVLDKKWSNINFLIHLVAHLNYHLGQINYHRRLIKTGQ